MRLPRTLIGAFLLVVLPMSAQAQGFLGVSVQVGISPLNNSQGCVVTSVVGGSAAEAVGIQPGDVIMSIDDGTGITLTINPNVLRSKIQGANTITLEIHTPSGPWQVIANVGAMMAMAAPGKGAVGSAPGSQPGGQPKMQMRAKQARPGGGAGVRPSPNTKPRPGVPPRPGNT